jgi:putative flippase GtrA
VSTTLSRFGIASLAALGTDFILTFILFSLTRLSLAGSAALSFIFVALIFYFVHETWTFPRKGAASSPKRLLQTFSVFSLAWLCRTAIIATLEYAVEPGAILGFAYFCVGAGASFTVNYVGTRHWAFRHRGTSDVGAGTRRE